MIVVLADDFTGAAELAGVASQNLRSIKLQTAYQPDRRSVLVVDMATRGLPDDEAVDRARSFAEQVAESDPEWVYVKIDSVLRGPIVPQLTAIAEELGKTQTLIVNANPKNGRSVRDGVLYVDGTPITETDFVNDPEHPAISDNVLDLLGLNDSNTVVLTPGDDWPATSFLVGNVSEQSHLDWFEQNIPRQTVMAGGAEFFRAILDGWLGSDEVRPQSESTHRKRESRELPLPLGEGWGEGQSKQGLVSETSKRCVETHPTKLELIPGTLIIAGSAIDWNKRKQRCEELEIPIIEFADNASTFIERIHDTLQANPTVMAAISCDRLETEDALSMRDALVAAIQEIITTQQLSQLIIEGGGTATDIIQKCGWSEMSVGPCFAQGVVALYNQEAPGLHIVVKPGSYKWPDELF